MATVTDVARLAEVSVATVSRAFNMPDRVDPNTLQKVRGAAAKLNYLPLGVARSLRSRRSMVVGMVIQSMENASYIAGMVELCQSLLAQQGYTMLLASSSFSEARAVESCRAMIKQGIDAMMLVAGEPDSEAYSLLRDFNIPHVGAWVYDHRHPSFGFDHSLATLEVVRYLLDLGHRDFAIVIPLWVSGRRRERLRVIRQALSSYGIEENRCLVDDSGLGILDGRAAVGRIMGQAPKTTAIICANDNLAAGAILECKARGLRIPDDVSVTGYNDLEIASAMDPSITTVRTPFEPVAEAAVNYLMAKLNNKPHSSPHASPTQLIVRQSAGTPRRS